MQFQTMTMLPTARSTKTRPPPTRSPANVHSACQYKRCFLALLFKRNIRLSFAVAILGSDAAFISHRAQPILRSGTFHPARLSFRELAFDRTGTGACADVVPGT
jgi:hypothetical protein